MTNTGQPSTIEERLNRLENFFANAGETIIAQNNTLAALTANIERLAEKTAEHDNALAALTANIERLAEKTAEHDATLDVVVSNIQDLAEKLNRLENTVDIFTINVNRFSVDVSRNIENLSAEAAQDRQQAAIDRQVFQNRVDQILNYLRDRNGGSSPLQ